MAGEHVGAAAEDRGGRCSQLDLLKQLNELTQKASTRQKDMEQLQQQTLLLRQTPELDVEAQSDAPTDEGHAAAAGAAAHTAAAHTNLRRELAKARIERDMALRSAALLLKRLPAGGGLPATIETDAWRGMLATEEQRKMQEAPCTVMVEGGADLGPPPPPAWDMLGERDNAMAAFAWLERMESLSTGEDRSDSGSSLSDASLAPGERADGSDGSSPTTIVAQLVQLVGLPSFRRSFGSRASHGSLASEDLLRPEDLLTPDSPRLESGSPRVYAPLPTGFPPSPQLESASPRRSTPLPPGFPPGYVLEGPGCLLEDPGLEVGPRSPRRTTPLPPGFPPLPPGYPPLDVAAPLPAGHPPLDGAVALADVEAGRGPAEAADCDAQLELRT